MASSSVCLQTTAFEIHTKGHNVPTTQEGGGGGWSYSVIWSIWGGATGQGGGAEFKSCSDR